MMPSNSSMVGPALCSEAASVAVGESDRAISPASASVLISEALAHVLSGGVDEWALRALHVAQARALRAELVGTPWWGRVPDAAVEYRRGIREAQECDHVVLVDAVA